MRHRLIALLGLMAIVVGACSTGGASPSPASSAPAAPTEAAASTPPASTAPVELTILGAASLKAALDEMEKAYEAANPGTTLIVSTDSSAALETQIEEGNPADVFLSADTANPKKLVDGGFASGAAVTFAGNKLTIIVPADNPGGVTTPGDLAKAGLKVIAALDEVPITKYTTQLIDNLAKEAGYPADFAAAYAANVASKEENVKGIVTRIETGEGDVGIVYVTDASASDKVTRIDVPDSANVPATYAGVVVKASPNQDAATAFLDWVVGPDGQAILSTFGFQPPTP